MTLSRRVFIKRTGMGVMSLAFAPSLARAFQYENITATDLPRSTPELQGMS